MLKLILKKSSSKNSSRLKSIQTDHIIPSIIKGDSQILEQQQVLGNQAMQQLSLINQRKISSEECLANPTIAASPQEPLKKTPEAIEEPAASKYSHPFTAIGMMAMTKTEKCGVPKGQYGVSKIVKFMIIDFKNKPVRSSLAVSEKFKLRDGPKEIFNLLKERSIKSDKKGVFDDCYRLYDKKALPTNLRLEVEQNHLIGSAIISTNYITYTPNNILVRIFQRPAGKSDFGKKSKVY